ncbi:MAG: GatB/YqeY domain-containing protein [Desulfobulbaceae bacterium]|jgi:uncharacterized protein YqeY|nr:GatB/YqeY domain-containing protein [Desulfobulbaceae bacterium]
MSLQARFKEELKESIKAKDTARTGAIRVMIGEFQRMPTKELTDEQVVAVIKKLIKSEKELLAASGQAASEYLAILEGYLPQQASAEEIRAFIRYHIDLQSFKTPMQAMRPILAHFGASADGNMVKSVLAEFAG